MNYNPDKVSEFTAKIINDYAKQSFTLPRSTTDLSPLEEFLISRMYLVETEYNKLLKIILEDGIKIESLNAKTNRQNVYTVIDREREYQDNKWGGKVHDNFHEVEAWLVYMQAYLSKAINRVSTEKGPQGALEEMRKVVAMGVACFEVHGVPERDNSNPLRSGKNETSKGI